MYRGSQAANFSQTHNKRSLHAQLIFKLNPDLIPSLKQTSKQKRKQNKTYQKNQAKTPKTTQQQPNKQTPKNINPAHGKFASNDHFL